MDVARQNLLEPSGAPQACNVSFTCSHLPVKVWVIVYAGSRQCGSHIAVATFESTASLAAHARILASWPPHTLLHVDAAAAASGLYGCLANTELC